MKLVLLLLMLVFSQEKVAAQQATKDALSSKSSTSEATPPTDAATSNEPETQKLIPLEKARLKVLDLVNSDRHESELICIEPLCNLSWNACGIK
jgi:hypothetical protein